KYVDESDKRVPFDISKSAPEIVFYHIVFDYTDFLLITPIDFDYTDFIYRLTEYCQLLLLLAPQAFNRVCQRGFDRLKTDGYRGYQQRDNPCQYKYPPMYNGAVGKVLQPFVHSVPG